MATKIRAKQSLASNEYGRLNVGEEGYCKASTAKQLVEWGMAEIVEENVEAPVKMVKPFITVGDYQPKSESKPVLYEEKEEKPEEPEKAAEKKQYEDEKEKKGVKETPKKQYK